MYAKTLAVAALAAVASAQIPAIARRDFIEPRQTMSFSDACQTAIQAVMPIYSELPTAPSDLTSIDLPTDACATPTLTGSLSSEYASYTSEVMVWYTSHSSELLAALSSCSELSQYATGIPVCSTATGGSAAKTTGTGTATSAKSTGTATSATKNFAARETGFVAAAMAAAGFVGVVAAL